MPNVPEIDWFLVAIGGAIMFIIMLRAIGQTAVVVADVEISQRRAEVERRKAEDAAAEAFGRAASLEPLALNPDGSVAEPILGVPEDQL